jgi:alkyldihydroxyacetonephosphate synthase
MLVGAAGEREQVDAALAAANAILRPQGAVILGRGPGRTWQKDRFRHPYLREALLDFGYATDTLETAVPWSRAAAARQAIVAAIAGSLEPLGERVAVLCHVSHPYRDGASLYFTFFFRPTGDPAETLHRWALAKRAANDALIAQGATMSHHHGVGQWHAPWLPAEVGAVGITALRAAAAALDPAGVMNPDALLATDDTLEA